MVTLWLNTTKAPLNDPEVRLGDQHGIDRQQLSAQGETNYEPPATSSSGLLLPTQAPCSTRPTTTTSPATSNNAKVTHC